MDHPDFAPDRHKIMEEASINFNIDKQFGWAKYVTTITPTWPFDQGLKSTSNYTPFSKWERVFAINLPSTRSLMLKSKVRDYTYYYTAKAVPFNRTFKAGGKPTEQNPIFYEILNEEVRPEKKTKEHLVCT